MRISFSILCFISILTAMAISCPAKEWRGIVPLHSTRSDVERALGPSDGECKCHYDTGAEFVGVEYAKAPCKGYPPGWNVAADTVLSIKVRLKSEQLFSDFKLDLSKYVISQDDTLTMYYASRDEGIIYSVSHDGRVNYVTYIPTTADQKFRCPGFPAEDGSITSYPRFDTYSNISFSNEMARLDNFAIQLQTVPDWKGYIMVYAGRRARPNEAKIRAERARDYLIKRRSIDPARVVAIDGGYREEFGVELYLIHKDYHAPLPEPFLSSKEVEIMKVNRKKKGARLR